MKSISKFRFLRMLCILVVVFLTTTCQKETKREIVACDHLRIQTVQGWVTSPGWLVDAINSKVNSYPTAQSGWRPYPYVYTFEYDAQSYILVFDPWEGNFLTRAIFFTCGGERIYVEQPAVIGWNDSRNRMIVIGGGLWGRLYNHVISRGIMLNTDRGIVHRETATLVWSQPVQRTTSTCWEIATNANGWIISPAWLRHAVDSLGYCGAYPRIYFFRHNGQDYFYLSGGGSGTSSNLPASMRFYRCTGEFIQPEVRGLWMELNNQWNEIIEAGKILEHFIWRRPQ